MRITNAMTAQKYTRDISTSYSRLVMTSNQVLTGRRYDKMSMDPSSGVRAMQVRRSMTKIESYQDNIKSAQSFYSAAETQIMQISDIVAEVEERWIEAINGTNESSDRQILATQLESLRDELLNIMNASFSGRYLFGGTNTIEQPFTVDGNGILYYNGVDVNTIDFTSELLNDASEIDIGLSNGAYFTNSFVGVELLGYGSENLYNVLTEMIDMIRDGNYDPDEMGGMLTRFQKSAESVNIQLTQLGADSKYLDFMWDSHESDRLNLIDRQDDLEGIDSAEAIMNLEIQQYIYTAALSIGSYLLQSSLFSYIS